MQVLKGQDYKLFGQIVSIKQPLLAKALKAYLDKKYKNVIETKDFIIAEGDIPVALVAHMDTVFKHPPRNIYYDERKNVMWSPDGLGADDRAGVFSILKIIQKGARPHVIFTNDEEIGGLGAEALIKQYPQSPFKDLKYIIQLDRSGTNDCVFYDCDNLDFIDYISHFGFIEDFGTFSDISVICPAWKIAGVNLSVGYMNEHSVAETLHIQAMMTTINKVVNMLKVANDIIEPFVYIPCARSFYWQKTEKFDEREQYYICGGCKKVFPEYEMFPVKMISGSTKMYCPDCIVNEHIDWCKICDEAFEISPEEHHNHICRDCQGGKYVNG